MFLLPAISDITPQYCCFCCASYHIYPHNITVSVTSLIRLNTKLFLSLFLVLSDIIPKYYFSSWLSYQILPVHCFCFCCLPYQIHPHNVTVSAASSFKYTTTILLFLLPHLPDKTAKYFFSIARRVRFTPTKSCFSYFSYQICPQNITVFLASPTRYTPTLLLFLFPVVSDITPQYYCFCCHFYQIYQHNIPVSVAFLNRYATKCYCFCCLPNQIYRHNISVPVAFLIRYNPTILLFCCLSYQIYHYNNSVPVAFPIRYNPTILLFCCLSYQIYPHNITLSFTSPIRYNTTIFLFLLPVLSDIPPQFYCFCCCPISYKPNYYRFFC